MSRKKQNTTNSGKPISGLRLPVEHVLAVKQEAENMERTLVAQIRVIIRDWYAAYKLRNPSLMNPTQSAPAPISGTVVRHPPTPGKPVPNVQTIIDDEKGWEHGN